MKYFLKIVILFQVFICNIQNSIPQSLQVGLPVIEEAIRRNQILNDSIKDFSFNIRHFSSERDQYFEDSTKNEKRLNFYILPIFNQNKYNTKYPFGWGNYGMPVANGFQTYLTAGFMISNEKINFEFQPEFFYSQNKDFKGFSRNFPSDLISGRFDLWNLIDNPEKLEGRDLTIFSLGQSKLSFKFKSIEIGISNKTIWWGPGQWNSLTFSNNARSFPHLSLNSLKPINSILGKFEGQILMGKLISSGNEPSQYFDLNSKYFIPFVDDWRYLNAINFSYSPKWIPNIFFGFQRTFQSYSKSNDFNKFSDFFPFFEVFSKEKLFQNGNSVIYDSNLRSQQAVVSLRYVNYVSDFEFYFEFGRRDHALNWREFFLNPEHARAYQLGFLKIAKLPSSKYVFQIRGELTEQTQSINRYIRYSKTGGSWHNHGQVLTGFTNYGKGLGLGIGSGTNIQSIEISILKNLNKYGFLFQRIENNKDFFYSSNLSFYDIKPWNDLIFGILADFKVGNLVISSDINLINSSNYQWNFTNTNPYFQNQNFSYSLNTNISFIYLMNK